MLQLELTTDLRSQKYLQLLQAMGTAQMVQQTEASLYITEEVELNIFPQHIQVMIHWLMPLPTSMGILDGRTTFPNTKKILITSG